MALNHRTSDVMLNEAIISLEENDKITSQERDKRIASLKETFTEKIPTAAKNNLSETEMRETMTTGDFPYALGEFVNRRILAGYKRKMFNFEPLVYNDVVPNFMEVTRYQNRSGVDDLEYIAEKGSSRPGYVSQATKRQYKVHKWGKQYDFSMEAFWNDDLGYFNEFIPKLGESARRTQEKFVSRMYFNATSIARLVALGALFSTTGRLTSTRISAARMGFNQRVDGRNEPIMADLKYLVYHPGLKDSVAQIQNSQLVPELATNGVNVVANGQQGSFTGIEDPYITGTAPTLPWFAFADPMQIKTLVLARLNGWAGPKIMRKKSDIEYVTDLLGAGAAAPPIMGDFASGNIVYQIMDVWGTYVDGTDGSLFDTNGAYYSSATAP